MPSVAHKWPVRDRCVLQCIKGQMRMPVQNNQAEKNDSNGPNSNMRKTSLTISAQGYKWISVQLRVGRNLR